MVKVDFYTGEAREASPNLVSVPQGCFSYDPAQRYQQFQMQQMQQQQFQPQPPPTFMNQPQPVGMDGYNGYYPPPSYQPANQVTMGSYFQDVWNMQQQMGNGLRVGENPALALFQKMQREQYEDKTVSVPGYRPNGSTTLYQLDIEEVKDKLQLDMDLDQDEAVERRRQQFSGYYSSYYGNYMYNYMDQGVYAKYKGMVSDIVKEAKERRTELNKNLSRLAHGSQNDKVTEADINQIYDGYTYTVPATNVRIQAHMDKLSSGTEVSNAEKYAKHDREISNYYWNFNKDCKTLDEFFEMQNVIACYDRLEEEFHRRRDNTNMYQSGSPYRNFIRRALRERDGYVKPENPLESMRMGDSVKLLEDGTLSISAPPNFTMDRQMYVRNLEEQNYEANRRRFVESIRNGGSV